MQAKASTQATSAISSSSSTTRSSPSILLVQNTGEAKKRASPRKKMAAELVKEEEARIARGRPTPGKVEDHEVACAWRKFRFTCHRLCRSKKSGGRRGAPDGAIFASLHHHHHHHHHHHKINVQHQSPASITTLQKQTIKKQTGMILGANHNTLPASANHF